MSIPEHDIHLINLTLVWEDRGDILSRRQSEPLSREWSLGSFFKTKRVRRAPSRQNLVQKPHAKRVSQTVQQRNSRRSIATVPEESDQDIAAQGSILALNPSLEKLAYRASEKSLSHSPQEDLTKAPPSPRLENQQPKYASSKDVKESQQLLKLQERLEEQERKLVLAQEELSRMRDELEGEKIKSVEAEKVKKQAIRNLAHASVKADPYQYDDDFFKKEFKTFRYRIEHWVRNQKWQLARNRSIPKNFKLLQSTTPYSFHYTSSQSGMEVLIDARIWKYLTEYVFGRDLWADGGIDDVQIKKNQRAYDTFKNILGRQTLKFLKDNELTSFRIAQNVSREHHAELYQDWRATNARIMAARDKPFTRTALRKITQEYSLDLKGDLELFAANDLDKTKNPFKGDKTNLEDLVGEAISLDAILQQQRPCFQFYPSLPQNMERWNLRFSESAMEVPDDDGEEILEGRQVRLILAPGLYKYGNSAGRNYAQRCTILKANVDVMGAI